MASVEENAVPPEPAQAAVGDGEAPEAPTEGEMPAPEEPSAPEDVPVSDEVAVSEEAPVPEEAPTPEEGDSPPPPEETPVEETAGLPEEEQEGGETAEATPEAAPEASEGAQSTDEAAAAPAAEGAERPQSGETVYEEEVVDEVKEQSKMHQSTDTLFEYVTESDDEIFDEEEVVEDQDPGPAIEASQRDFDVDDLVVAEAADEQPTQAGPAPVDDGDTDGEVEEEELIEEFEETAHEETYHDDTVEEPIGVVQPPGGAPLTQSEAILLLDDVANVPTERIVNGDVFLDEDLDIEEQNRDINPPIRTRQAPMPVKNKKSANPDGTFHVFVCILYLLMVGGAVAVSVLYILDDDSSPAVVPPTPTSAPAVMLPAATSSFDELQGGNCNLGSLTFPHVIDQCTCGGMISTIPEDVERQYNVLRERFIPFTYESYDETISSCSMRNQALFWLATGDNFRFGSEELRQRFALATLFVSAGGAGWTASHGWLSTSIGSCVWFGVTCNSESAVESLLLVSNGLDGFIPREFSLLEELSTISLPGNNLQKGIPREVFTIPSLKVLSLNSNGLEGNIPITIAEATSLERFEVMSNALSGSIPTHIGGATNLSVLNLADNTITGEIPSQLYDLTSLEELQIQQNELAGTISPEIGNLKSTLKTLEIGTNFLSGNLDGVALLTNLETLRVEDVGSMAGTIPTSLGLLTELSVLVISATDVFAVIPTELANLGKLTEVNLSFNRLYGEIPTELGGLTMLESLILDGNSLQGGVSDEICTLRNGALQILVVNCDVGCTCCTSCTM